MQKKNQHHGDIVRQDVTEAIRSLLLVSCPDNGMQRTVFTLVPKVGCHIACCNVTYKCITKI